MKDTIYTIPLTDAFKAEDECPFCFIKRKLEQDAISFILGSAYMEEDIREVTDQIGFCAEHYKKMYDYGNRLGLALMLHTHYTKLQQELRQKLEHFCPEAQGLMTKLKKLTGTAAPSSNPMSSWIKEKHEACYICDAMDKNFSRYMDTFFYLMSHNDDFKPLFLNCKGFCLPHFGEVLSLSENKLSDKQKETFYPILFDKMQSHFKRLDEDIAWFIDKYDYKNTHADWKTSKDAIPRGIQKLAGIYVQDTSFKEK